MHAGLRMNRTVWESRDIGRFSEYISRKIILVGRMSAVHMSVRLSELPCAEKSEYHNQQRLNQLQLKSGFHAFTDAKVSNTSTSVSWCIGGNPT